MTGMQDASVPRPVDAEPAAHASAATTHAARGPDRRVRRPSASAFAGLAAVGVKELRGRMRGRRAFVILTVYLVLLAAFAWMVELILERQYARDLSGSAAYASALVGQGVFAALMMLETLLVVALAPAFTAGAISQEREKQTLDMLTATPISSLAIVVAKLFSALTYLFILILASIPLTALVFVFGGVAPEDVVRGYVVLVVTAIGLGAVGLFFSALLKRTQAATVATYFGVLFVTLGSFFIFYFWNEMSTRVGRGVDLFRTRPPELLVWLNPYFAQADVLCGVEGGGGQWCNRLAFVTDGRATDGVPQPLPMPALPAPAEPGVVAPGGPGFPQIAPEFGVVPDRVEVFDVGRDGFWPKSAAAWLALSVVLVAASVRLVGPGRRRRSPLRRQTAGRMAG